MRIVLVCGLCHIYLTENVMSNNIQSLSIKEMDNFIVPLREVDTLFDSHRNIDTISPLTISFEGGSERGEIVGVVTDSEHMRVTSINWGGVASGSLFDQFNLLLERSTGKLVMIIIWDDVSIERVTVQDGQISIEEVTI